MKYKTDAAGWVVVPSRVWIFGDQIKVMFHLGPKLILGEFGNAGHAALAWGPFVLAFDRDLNPSRPAARRVGLTESHPLLTRKPGPRLAFKAKIVGQKGNDPQTAVFVPFADAGAGGGEYCVWLRAGHGGEGRFLVERRPGKPVAAGKSQGLHHRRPAKHRCDLRRAAGPGRLVCGGSARPGQPPPRGLRPWREIP